MVHLLSICLSHYRIPLLYTVRDFGLENENWSDWDTDYENMLVERVYTDRLFGQRDENKKDMLEVNEYSYYNT